MHQRILGEGLKTSTSRGPGVAPPLPLCAFGPMGSAASGPWAEIYRVAYERSVEALRPTHYDRAMAASEN